MDKLCDNAKVPMGPFALSEFLLSVILPFALWMIAWWRQIFGDLGLSGDAFFYYWDSRFFLDNISHGVYPLWNPQYSDGVPWNFFLRRMGEINPFYWTVNFLKYLGFSALHAHILFLVLYFFLGTVGFWLLARLFLRSSLLAAGAYLLLLFAWGAQLFYCFEVLIFVPLIWFFYFLLAFGKEAKKHHFLGMFFCLSLLFNTYVPFFALTIILSVLLFIFFFFSRASWNYLVTTKKFICAHKIFAALSIGFFIVACVPEVSFFLESQKGNFVMPVRHLGSTNRSVLAVTSNIVNHEGDINYHSTVWDILAYTYFDKEFANQPQMTLSHFNIAYLFFIIPLLALINPLSLRTAFLLSVGTWLVLINVTNGRLYPFLLKHLFFFQYMRMLHLFFWLGVLPIAILWVMEQLRVFIENFKGSRNVKVLIFVIAVHMAFFFWLMTHEGVLWTSYLAVILSLFFFILILKKNIHRVLLRVIFYLCLLIQPLSFAHYILQNSIPINNSIMEDHSSMYQGKLTLPVKSSQTPPQEVKSLPSNTALATGYYESPWFNMLRQYISQEDIIQFIAKKFIFFDNSLPEDRLTFSKLDKMWYSLENQVFLPRENSIPEDFRTLAPHVSQAQVAYKNTVMLKVVAFDVNTLVLKTSLDHPKFLLWVNGYHPGWKAYVDGHPGRLLRADYMFKGLWIPEGNHQIIFRFGSPLRYAAAEILLASCIIVLFLIVALGLIEGFTTAGELHEKI